MILPHDRFLPALGGPGCGKGAAWFVPRRGAPRGGGPSRPLSSAAGASAALGCESAITGGDFKFVCISPDVDVDTLLEGMGSCEKGLELEPGETRIARIGVDASGSFSGKLIGLGGATSQEIG